MQTSDVIRNRKSVRAYKDQEVADEVIQELLELASCSPSGANTQPWQVAVLRGETKDRLAQKMIEAFESGEKMEKDYQYYPVEWVEPFNQRRFYCGNQLYQALDIERHERDRRRSQWALNYRAFNAPVMLLFFLDSHLEAGSYIDYGMFLQTLMLAAMEMGLATCPEAALAEYPDLVRNELNIQGEPKLLCGMALGYEDASHPVNQYRTPRADVNSFTSWFD